YTFFFLILLPPPRPTLFPYTDALPISSTLRFQRPESTVPKDQLMEATIRMPTPASSSCPRCVPVVSLGHSNTSIPATPRASPARSEEHTSELQSLAYLVCRLLLEKKKK